jgi:hypothetical protein
MAPIFFLTVYMTCYNIHPISHAYFVFSFWQLLQVMKRKRYVKFLSACLITRRGDTVFAVIICDKLTRT